MRAYGVNTDNKWLRLPDDQVGIYNEHDTRYTALLHRAVRDDLASKRLLDFYDREIRPLVPAVLSMQRRGLTVLQPEYEAYRDEIHEERTALEEWICERAGMPRRVPGKPFWMSSSQPQGGQRAVAFFDRLGFTPAPPTRTRPARSTNQDALLYIYDHMRKRDEENRDFIENFFHWGKLNTIASRYLRLRLDDDGRVRPVWKMARQKNLRLSATEPPVHQFPRKSSSVLGRARCFLGAAPGHILVAADYRQLEARILAVRAGDDPSLEAFAQGDDIHAVNATDLFASDEVSDAARNYAKTFLYKLSYGGSGESEARLLFCPCPRCREDSPPTLDLSADERARAGARWNAKHRAVLRFRDELVREVRESGGWYTDPLGFRRLFAEVASGRWSANVERELYNVPMQLAATLIKNRAIVRLHEQGAPLWLDHHDAIYLEVPMDEEHAWAQKLLEAMEEPVPELGGTVFPISLESGRSWYEMKKRPRY